VDQTAKTIQTLAQINAGNTYYITIAFTQIEHDFFEVKAPLEIA
jgi:hypothetical protein